MSDLSKEPLAGILCSWNVHNIYDALKKLDLLKSLKDGALPYIVTAEIVEDFTFRFGNASTMYTSNLCDFDLASMRIKTQNSVYELQGPGLFTYSVPKDVDDSVGDTILALSFFENQQLRWISGESFNENIGNTTIREAVDLNQSQKLSGGKETITTRKKIKH